MRGCVGSNSVTNRETEVEASGSSASGWADADFGREAGLGLEELIEKESFISSLARVWGETQFG